MSSFIECKTVSCVPSLSSLLDYFWHNEESSCLPVDSHDGCTRLSNLSDIHTHYQKNRRRLKRWEGKRQIIADKVGASGQESYVVDVLTV